MHLPACDRGLIAGLVHQDQRYVEACLCCLRTLFLSELAPVECMYEEPWAVRHLLLMATQMHATNQECIATILMAVCKTPDHQNYLCAHGAVPTLTALLCSPVYKVQLPTLRCLTHMCYQNPKVSQALATSSYGGRTLPDILVTLMARDKPTEMQLAAAKCMTFISRAGAMHSEDPRIVFKALPTLVRMCKKENTPEERALGAETLAYLAEVDTELQRIASISDHLIPTLAELFKYQPPSAVVLYKGPVPAVTMKKVPSLNHRQSFDISFGTAEHQGKQLIFILKQKLHHGTSGFNCGACKFHLQLSLRSNHEKPKKKLNQYP
ncbi:hypothetical protein V5799_025196 [Amblyomma americanum]|uniref:Armadillo repeat-containing protein 8 n=1 Tax=Amblyomma americanum TaxID=6943 RepID=A0AAQ4EA55_AMBAM